jgi:hypothetical protein
MIDRSNQRFRIAGKVVDDLQRCSEPVNGHSFLRLDLLQETHHLGFRIRLILHRGIERVEQDGCEILRRAFLGRHVRKRVGRKRLFPADRIPV